MSSPFMVLATLITIMIIRRIEDDHHWAVHSGTNFFVCGDNSVRFFSVESLWPRGQPGGKIGGSLQGSLRLILSNMYWFHCAVVTYHLTTTLWLNSGAPTLPTADIWVCWPARSNCQPSSTWPLIWMMVQWTWLWGDTVLLSNTLSCKS